MPKKRRNPLLDFYLPCAVSGLLLAGLIAFTNPETAESVSTLAPTVVALR